MHTVINFQSVRCGISIESNFFHSPVNPNLEKVRAPSSKNKDEESIKKENTNGQRRKSVGRRQEILSFVRDKSGSWRTSVPRERKPCRHQRRSLFRKRKEQRFGVVETSGRRLLKYLARPGRVKMGREVEQSLGQKSDLWAPHHHHHHHPHHHHQRDRDSAVLGEEIRSVGHKAGKKSDLLCS